MTPDLTLTYIDADETWKARMAEAWDAMTARHMHLTDGFTLLALDAGVPVGLISVYWRDLPAPLAEVQEGFIDIIGVSATHRRRGIATTLVAMAAARARAQGAYQLRAWSSEDKTEAIPLWQRLGFGLCPATVYPGGVTVRGYFVAQVLSHD